MAVSKLVLIGSGVGASIATAGGVALYLTSGETMVNRISKEANLKNKKFISLVSDAAVHLQKKYSSSKEQKPTKDGKTVKNIVEWCKDSENIKFSSESDPNYSLINTWCFVDTTSLSERAKQNKKKDIIGEKTSEAWKSAWETYNARKGTVYLRIADTDLIGVTDKGQGGVALYEWCKDQDKKKMYEVHAESNYSRYEKWCFEQSS